MLHCPDLALMETIGSAGRLLVFHFYYLSNYSAYRMYDKNNVDKDHAALDVKRKMHE